jgi:Ca2+-binding EF-hand superfamily protein
MSDYRITEDQAELQAIFEIFDSNKNGTISYNEFIRAIVGEMN